MFSLIKSTSGFEFFVFTKSFNNRNESSDNFILYLFDL